MVSRCYTIRSTSADGVYYLVNGWNKHNTFWARRENIEKCIFKSPGLALRSLKHLLKIMEDYKSDFFEMCEIDRAGVPITIQTLRYVED
jgi:hypothetical protein